MDAVKSHQYQDKGISSQKTMIAEVGNESVRVHMKDILTRNIEGTKYVKISKAFPVANRTDERNRHFFASESNFLP